jgi:hypothetical protein
VALTPDGLEAVVADYHGDRVGRIQLATGRVDFPFGGDGEFKSANSVAVADDGSFALVTNWGNGTVGWIDLLSNKNQKKGTRPEAYSGFKNPTGVAISPDWSCALVSCDGDDTVRRLELATGAVTAVFKGFRGPRGVALSPDGAWALVANLCGHNVGLIDLTTGDVTFPAALSGLKSARAVGLSADGSCAVVSLNQNPGQLVLFELPPTQQPRRARLADELRAAMAGADASVLRAALDAFVTGAGAGAAAGAGASAAHAPAAPELLLLLDGAGGGGGGGAAAAAAGHAGGSYCQAGDNHQLMESSARKRLAELAAAANTAPALPPPQAPAVNQQLVDELEKRNAAQLAEGAGGLRSAAGCAQAEAR